MKSITLAFAALAGTAAAQSSYYNVSSDPFRLFVKSDNATINGIALGACHQGAATEGLCITGERRSDPASSYTTFSHNISTYSSALPNAVDEDGVLAWVLHAGGGLNVSSAMSFSSGDVSNIAVPIFMPGEPPYTLVSFGECGSMYKEAYQNDTVSPPEGFSPPLKVMNWYICLTRWSYTYVTLVWKVGLTGEPQNPSCQKVDVERVWVK